ncbi:hypothetical protein M758_12G172000 [Ceratodon purpureus]|nr:hypothetical protein M758_12G172000 [Ceratodon purpureus]
MLNLAMDAWRAKVGGGSAAESVDLAGLPRDSYEEQERKQQEHLSSRECFQVFVNVLGARNVPEVSRRKGFYVTLRGIQNCGSFKLMTPTVEKVEDLRWPGEYRMLHFDMSTAGFVLELTCTRNMWPDKPLGRISILFNHLLRIPEGSVEAWYPLPQEKNSPELLVKASIRPAVRSPYLLRAIKGDFQKDNFETIVPKRSKQKPEGRWSTRTVLDHDSQEKYLIRVRRAKVKRRYQNEWNAPVEEWEKEVCIYQRRFEQFNRKIYSMQVDSVAGWAQQQINTHSFKKDSHIQRQWSLFAGEDTEFKVQRDVNNVNWVEDLHLSLTGKGFGYPVELRTGRHLQYGISNAKEDPEYESGYVTVIRKTPDCPAGKATALFNWKAIAMEVSDSIFHP